MQQEDENNKPASSANVKYIVWLGNKLSSSSNCLKIGQIPISPKLPQKKERMPYIVYIQSNSELLKT